MEVIHCRNVSRETILMKEIIPPKAYRVIVFDLAIKGWFNSKRVSNE
jgi:hypothetical protein